MNLPAIIVAVLVIALVGYFVSVGLAALLAILGVIVLLALNYR